ncbi:hypothetical protein CW304_09040 [Bacillus sp. UFRGS-B20]|nr:hypothetical protein CW304_09040 [Bacillus sp. UFRGS-B20]
MFFSIFLVLSLLLLNFKGCNKWKKPFLFVIMHKCLLPNSTLEWYLFNQPKIKLFPPSSLGGFFPSFFIPILQNYYFYWLGVRVFFSVTIIPKRKIYIFNLYNVLANFKLIYFLL